MPRLLTPAVACGQGIRERRLLRPSVKVLSLSYRGKIPIDYQRGCPYNTLPLSEWRDLWGVGTVHACTLTYPFHCITWGTREMCF